RFEGGAGGAGPRAAGRSDDAAPGRPAAAARRGRRHPGGAAMSDEVLKAARRVLEIEAESVRALAERLDERFARAVQVLLACRGRVVVTGIGKSGLVARKLAATLAATRTPSLFLHPPEAVPADLALVLLAAPVIP